jgi:cathepsin L
MRSFATAALVAVASARLSAQDFEFVNYMAKFGKSYETLEEFQMRAALFQKWDQEIKQINANEYTSTHGHNHLSDWTAEEKTRLLGLKNMHIELQPRTAESEVKVGAGAPPTSWNWVTAGNYVNPIQDQGQCGSCWAFAAAAAMESAHAIFQGSLYKLSEQNLVSCAGARYGNLGCNGGLQTQAWNYAKTNPLESEANYPYTSGTTMKTGSCTYNASLGIGQV